MSESHPYRLSRCVSKADAQCTIHVLIIHHSIQTQNIQYILTWSVHKTIQIKKQFRIRTKHLVGKCKQKYQQGSIISNSSHPSNQYSSLQFNFNPTNGQSLVYNHHYKNKQIFYLLIWYNFTPCKLQIQNIMPPYWPKYVTPHDSLAHHI